MLAEVCVSADRLPFGAISQDFRIIEPAQDSSFSSELSLERAPSMLDYVISLVTLPGIEPGIFTLKV